MKNLPIYDVLPQIKKTLKINNKLILQAQAGAGKSTVVPISLLEEEFLEGKTIIMLEPRRVAVRAVANQMAKLLGEKVGQRVGYQVKMDSCFSKETKILVVTEGILTKKLQSDQALENIGLVIFDEFHERSIHSDLSLALCLQSQELLREDLRVLIMSATLNSNELTTMIKDAASISSKGRVFDIEDIYLPLNIKHPDIKSIPLLVADTIVTALKEDEGDILVFLAGVKEILEVEKLLQKDIDNTKIDVFPLYSNLSKEEQDKAIVKSSTHTRKIILSTNISQTSLTIEGIKVVIDSGVEKVSNYHPSNHMNHLDYSFISKDSSIQRAGRAGRLSSGKCYKLWHKNRILEQASKPEILRGDLSSLLLDLALWGVEDFEELKFLDVPSSSFIDSSRGLLKDLKMLDESNIITEYGKKALSLGIHPRFANMMLKANDLGLAYEASILVSLLNEKDIFKHRHTTCDIYDRFSILLSKDFYSKNINIFRAEQILKEANYFLKKIENIQKIGNKKSLIPKEMLSVLLLFAYPSRLAQLRNKNENKYKLGNAKGAILNSNDMLFNTEYLVVPNISTRGNEAFINSASVITREYIEKYFSMYIKEKEVITYKKESKTFDIRLNQYFFDIELSSNSNFKIEKEKYPKLIMEVIQTEGLELLPFNKKTKRLIDKVLFVSFHQNRGINVDISLPDLSTQGLQNSLDKWLEPYLQNITSLKDLEKLDVYSMVKGLIPWEDFQKLELLVPHYIKVPSGTNIIIDYDILETPVLKVKIQEIFGMKETPTILNNQIALQLHLLTPAFRPIQITYDIKSFWERSYLEVRKELRGKYKKHYWPEDPYSAIPTKKVKKYM